MKNFKEYMETETDDGGKQYGSKKNSFTIKELPSYELRTADRGFTFSKDDILKAAQETDIPNFEGKQKQLKKLLAELWSTPRGQAALTNSPLVNE